MKIELVNSDDHHDKIHTEPGPPGLVRTVAREVYEARLKVRRCTRHVWAVRVTRARPAASRPEQSTETVSHSRVWPRVGHLWPSSVTSCARNDLTLATLHVHGFSKFKSNMLRHSWWWYKISQNIVQNYHSETFFVIDIDF